MLQPLSIPAATPDLSAGWLVVTAILMAASAVMMFFPRTPACLTGYAALWTGRLSGYAPFADNVMIFWGVAVAIVIINRRLLPTHIRLSQRGLGYIATGALTGMALGLTMHTAASIIVGAGFGAIIGAIAYSRTARGSILDFPSSRFFNYLGAKGIPATIAAVMIGFILAGIIAFAIPAHPAA